MEASPLQISTPPDLLTMAESGLLAAVYGNWEISHDSESAVWGRAVVKGLRDAVILTGTVIPCSFGFRHGPNPKVDEVYTAAITIQWGPDDSPNYATLESSGQDFLKWRLPTQADGSLGSYTIWRRLNVDASKHQAAKEVKGVRMCAKEVKDERMRAEEELANLRKEADKEVLELRTELVELRVKAADQVSESRSQSAIEIAAVQTRIEKEIADARAKVAFSDELAEARAKCADEIADENESLRVQLNSQVASSDCLREQVESLRMLVKEMTPLCTSSQASKFKDLLLDERIWPLRAGRQQEGTPDKEELPLQKRRRTDIIVGKENVGKVSNDNNVLADLALVSCGDVSIY